MLAAQTENEAQEEAVETEFTAANDEEDLENEELETQSILEAQSFGSRMPAGPIANNNEEIPAAERMAA
jgi:hypothetical protein